MRSSSEEMETESELLFSELEASESLTESELSSVMVSLIILSPPSMSFNSLDVFGFSMLLSILLLLLLL